MMFAKKVNKLITQGCSEQLGEETNRKVRVINLFAFVGVSLTLVLGIRAIIDGNAPLALILLLATTLFGVSQRIHLNIDGTMGRVLSMNLLLTCLMGLMAVLVVTGGNGNTGPLWIYIVPPVAMFFGGFRRGLQSNFGFILLIALLLFFPDERLLLTSYSVEFKTRLIYSFLTVTFLSAFYEYSRQKTFETVQRLSERFEQQARQDPLTRLPNRRGVQQYIDYEMTRMARSGRPMTLILADVDRFKAINDTYGHDNGDQILMRIAQTFRARIRRQDIVARWGGEEFLFVLPETPESNAMILANDVREALAELPVNIDGNRVAVTASFGVCEVNADVTLNRALSLADKALYRAKDNGRNRVCAASQLDD